MKLIIDTSIEKILDINEAGQNPVFHGEVIIEKYDDVIELTLNQKEGECLMAKLSKKEVKSIISILKNSLK